MNRVLSRHAMPIEAVFPSVPYECAYCGKGIGRKGQKWCSSYCSNAAWREVNVRRGVSGYIRSALAERDCEICNYCGVDLRVVKRILQRAVRSIGESRADDPERFMEWYLEHRIIWPLYGERSAFGKFWQADHIIEVADGGPHRMENLQTLCTICHKEKTAEYAAVRAGRL